MFACSSMAGFMAVNKSKIPSSNIYSRCNDHVQYKPVTFNVNIPWSIIKSDEFGGQLLGRCSFFVKKHNNNMYFYKFIGSGKMILSYDLTMAKLTQQIYIPGYNIVIKPTHYQFTKNMVLTIN